MNSTGITTWRHRASGLFTLYGLLRKSPLNQCGQICQHDQRRNHQTKYTYASAKIQGHVTLPASF